jgi:hypothetical protein
MYRLSNILWGFCGIAAIGLLSYSVGFAQSPDQLIAGERADVMVTDTPDSQPSEMLDTRLPLIRLPRYFSGLVDQQQRMLIQEIQVRYRSRIAELAKEMELLRGQQMREMEQVLTDAQLKLLNKKREQSRTLMADGQVDSDETKEQILVTEGTSP